MTHISIAEISNERKVKKVFSSFGEIGRAFLPHEMGKINRIAVKKAAPPFFSVHAHRCDPNLLQWVAAPVFVKGMQDQINTRNC